MTASSDYCRRLLADNKHDRVLLERGLLFSLIKDAERSQRLLDTLSSRAIGIFQRREKRLENEELRKAFIETMENISGGYTPPSELGTFILR